VHDKRWQELGQTVAALATDGILIQRRLQADAENRRQEFVSLLASLPESVRSLLLPLAPVEHLVKRHTVSCSVRVTASRSVSGSMVVSPINLGFSQLYGTSQTEQSKLTVEVVAYPQERAGARNI